MIPITEEIRAIIDKAANGLTAREDEYIDPVDGLIHCHACGKPRQTVLEMPYAKRIIVPRCSCPCEVADVTNDTFAENAWYFRNALVRANYSDLKNGIYETTKYLELFLENLLLDKKNELKNRTQKSHYAHQQYIYEYSGIGYWE